MNVSSWSIKNPVPALILFILLTLAGFQSFNAMKIQNFPDLELPTINVIAALPGASPAQLENEVAQVRKQRRQVARFKAYLHRNYRWQRGANRRI